MAEPFLGEIRMFAGSFAPDGWQFCDGKLYLAAAHPDLFDLIGTTYGGNDREFAVPDLQGRIPIHMDDASKLGETGGVEEVTLTVQQIPPHTHAFRGAAVAGNQTSAAGAVPAHSLNVIPYRNTATDANMHPQAMLLAGGSQPHENLQPFLVISFIIAFKGVIPNAG
jgi:microcystin-dependent protein